MSEARVLRCEPILVEKVWGSEAWLVADLPEADTGVGAQVRHHGAEFVGARAPDPDRFPLLLKLIDTRADLSVQVHPSHAAAAQDPGAYAKDESWLILDAEPGARVLHGFKDGVTRASFEAALEAGAPEDLLRAVVVKPGDVIRVEPGTVHAIGAGIFLLELQEPSDTTYRVWDYNRPGLDGKPRELHKERALAVANFDEQPPTKLTPIALSEGHELLVDAERYRLERVSLDGERTFTFGGGTAMTVLVTAGAATLSCGDQAFDLDERDCVVVPASAAQMTLAGRATITLGGVGGRSLVERALVDPR